MISLLALTVFLAWRYSRTSIDPDWAYFNLRTFTGARYGYDFADCKTPGVHWYYYALSKIVGANIARIRFANHLLVGSSGMALFALTANFPAALAFTLLVNSGWLLTFHGNVGQVPAALIAVALAFHHPAASVLWLAAAFYEPKLAPSFAVYAVLHGWWFLTLSIPLAVAFYLSFRDRTWFKLFVESSLLIPARMAKNRSSETWIPWFTANPLLYVLPWIAAGTATKPDFLYWLPALVYLAFIATGRVIRPNHFIPLVPWLALSGLSLNTVLVLVGIDVISSGLYLGNVWSRYYPALNDFNDEARKVGEWLRDKPGTIYVNGIHSGIYVHARKPVILGMTEQIEIREVAVERRNEMLQRWKKSPPDWVVAGEVPGIHFKAIGYMQAATIGSNVIYRKGRQI